MSLLESSFDLYFSETVDYFLRVCVGLVLKEANNSPEDNDVAECKLDVTHKFRELTHWNLDKVPNSDDKIIGVMQWIDLAKAVSKNLYGCSVTVSVIGPTRIKASRAGLRHVLGVWPHRAPKFGIA